MFRKVFGRRPQLLTDKAGKVYELWFSNNVLAPASPWSNPKSVATLRDDTSVHTCDVRHSPVEDPHLRADLSPQPPTPLALALCFILAQLYVLKCSGIHNIL